MTVTAFIGLGEAGRAFAGATERRGDVRAFDVKLREPATRGSIEAAAVDCGAALAETTGEAVTDAPIVLSLVTADQAVTAAVAAAPHLAQGTLYCDLNSISPNSKRRAAQVVEAAGGRYVDVAVMAPVLPSRLAVPLLVAGPHAEAAAAALATLGFERVRVLDGGTGAASAVKMIRSVLVKGLEALTAECFLAAWAAGVLAEVTDSLDVGWPGADWTARADRNLDRMMIHGMRRAAEMEEVAGTLDALGVDTTLSRATAERQRAIGGRLITPPDGLESKLALLLAAAPRKGHRAAA